jgi:protocatechuate 3,4-dioxygenase beta subunit/RNase P/RNase MRP subunit p29
MPAVGVAQNVDKQTVTLAGHVIDETTRAFVGNAEVILRSDLGEETTQTKDNGAFSIEVRPGTYRVAVRGGGVVTAGLGDRVRLDGGPVAALVAAPDETLMPTVHATTDIPNLEITATPSGTIVGRVVDSKTQPIAHAIVRARGTFRSALGTDVAETDARGEFSLEVPAGRYALDARAPGFAGLETKVEVVARAHASQRVALLVTRGCEIRGRVLHADDSPASDGAIERRTTTSQEFGPAGRIEPDGTFAWTTTEEADVVLRGWPWKGMPSQERQFACKDGARFTDVVLRVPDRAPALAGTVVDATGAPVPFAYVDVEALDLGHGSQQERADASGRWEVHELWPGRYQVTAGANERGIAVTTVVAPRSEDVKVQLGGTGRIEGTTIGLANGTVQMSFVACFDALDLQRRPMTIAHEPRLVPVTGGRFAIDDAPACDIQISARWRDQFVHARVVVPPSGIGHLELVLGEPHQKTVHGMVLDRGAHPVPNARVTADLDGRNAAATTDDQGWYSLRTFSGAALAAGDGSHGGRGQVGRANIPDERVDITLDQ